MIILLKDILLNMVTFLTIYGVFWMVFTSLEQNASSNKHPFFSKQVWQEWGNGVFNQLISSPIVSAIIPLLSAHIYDYILPKGLFTSIVSEWPTLLQILLMIFFLDLTQYLRHRFTHKFMWNFHATHHAALELRSTAHFRLHPLDYFVSNVFYSIAFYALGFDAHIISISLLCAAIYNMWLHTSINLEYPSIFRYLISSPNYHKWHHSKSLKAIDKNFADFFPIFDYIGGTYYFPKNKLPTSYGVHGVKNSDPLYQNFLGAFWYPFRIMKKTEK